jgi:hypothetical protein
MHAIIETPDYLDDADDAGLTVEERSKSSLYWRLIHWPGLSFPGLAALVKYGSPAEIRAKAEGIAS